MLITEEKVVPESKRPSLDSNGGISHATQYLIGLVGVAIAGKKRKRERPTLGRLTLKKQFHARFISRATLGSWFLNLHQGRMHTIPTG